MTTTTPDADTELPPVRAVDTRAPLSLLSIGLLVFGAIGLLAGSDRVQAIGLVAFALVGPGAALLAFVRLPGGQGGRLVLSFGASYTLLMILSMGSVYADVWEPTSTLWVVAALSAVVHLYVVVSEKDQLRSLVGEDVVGSVRQRSVFVPLLAALVCVVAALISQDDDPPIWGFFRVVNPIWWIGIAVLLGFAIVELRPQPARSTRHSASVEHETRFPLSAVLFGLVLTLTPVLVYGHPRSQSSSKHEKLAELIEHTHQFKSSAAIYNDWPGFFSTSAWLKEFGGMTNYVSLSTWWPFIIVLIRLIAVQLLAAQFLPNRRAAWLASILTYVSTPYGMDYFSPQSIGYTLGMVVLWIAVAKGSSSRLRLVLTVFVSLGIVATHQLSPYIIGGALVVLAIFRQLRPWWLAAGVLVPTVAWTLRNFEQVKYYVTPSGVGSSSNYALPVQSNDGSARFIVTFSIGVTAVTLLVVSVLAAIMLFRYRRTVRAWSLAVSSVVGLGAVFVTAYGNEGTFRAVFFAMPWLSIMAAQALYDFAASPNGILRNLTASSLVVTAVCGSIGVYALDSSNVIRPGDIAITNQVVAIANDNPTKRYAVLSLGAGNIPTTSSTSVKNLSLYRLKQGAVNQIEKIGDERYASVLAKQVRAFRTKATPRTIRVLSSPAVRAYADEYGQSNFADYTRVAEALDKSPLWKRDFSVDGTLAWTLRSSAD